MEIPGDVLSLLSCVECGAVLSRGPVFQAHDGAALCGRCVRPDRPTSRNQVYEAVAQLLRFPCRNRELGCTDTVPFTRGEEDVLHELQCPYRQYLCPVVPRGQCDWLGSRRQMLEHCETQHPGTVVRNGVQLTYDITKSSQNTYVLYALRVLFLLHTKVCVTTGKIFHSLRLLGNNAAKFSFTVDVKRDTYLVSKSYPVAPPGCLAMQEDTPLALSINSLLEILDGFKGTKFIVTVYDTTGCTECSAKLKKYYYPNLAAEGWLCDSCAPAKRFCMNKDKGCTHRDIDKKCENHKWFFCPLSTHCYFCDKTIPEETLNAHYTSVHSDITYASGSTWRNTFKNDNKYLITTKFTLIRCRSLPNNNQFHELAITCSLLSEELYELCCEIKLSHPVTNQSKTYNCKVSYTDTAGADYRLKVLNDDVMCNDGQYDVCITVSKVVN